MIVFVFHLTDLFLIFDSSPWQLTGDEFNEHVEQTPQVIVSTHFLGTRKERRDEDDGVMRTLFL